MEKLLPAFLYEHKECPLPGIGTLMLMSGEAKLLTAEQKILAPIPYVELSPKETSPYLLIEKIASIKQISHQHSADLLRAFCDSLQQLPAFGEQLLGTAGSFYMDEKGRLHFKSSAMPAAFFPPVEARRVIRTDVAHEMLVGDTYTDTNAMTERLAEQPERGYRWWIAAVVLGVISLAFIAAYFLQPHHGIGSDFSMQPAATHKTYTR